MFSKAQAKAILTSLLVLSTELLCKDCVVKTPSLMMTRAKEEEASTSPSIAGLILKTPLCTEHSV